ncbi:MAG: 50S ribosomal protein L17 [Planctomycetaceae bacterium]|nr:50S ribosomal protein L17 [Planctomycetaceae bacterium]
MRHRRKGRVLGRSPSHQRALLRNLASALFLTERDADEYLEGAPKVKGRIVTTLEKAKEVRPVVERCITLARRAIDQRKGAEEFGTTAARNSEEWKSWKKSDRYKKWVKAVAPSVQIRRRINVMLGDKKAVEVLFNDVAKRFDGRPGGYTRIMRLAKPRLGDSGTRAILEFVGVRDRAAQASPAPAFEGGEAEKK